MRLSFQITELIFPWHFLSPVSVSIFAIKTLFSIFSASSQLFTGLAFFNEIGYKCGQFYDSIFQENSKRMFENFVAFNWYRSNKKSENSIGLFLSTHMHACTHARTLLSRHVHMHAWSCVLSLVYYHNLRIPWLSALFFRWISRVLFYFHYFAKLA